MQQGGETKKQLGKGNVAWKNTLADEIFHLLNHFFVLFFFTVAFGKCGELISSKSDIVLLPCLVLLRYAAHEDG